MAPTRTSKSPSRGMGVVNKPVTMLSTQHIAALKNIGLRAILMVVGMLFFVGTLGPKFVGWDLYTASRYAGCSAIVILGLNFFNAYQPGVKGLNVKQREMGFVVFWFCATLFFDAAWQLPLWNIPFIR